MAHFAKIEDNKVTQVIVVSDNDCGGGIFPESDIIGNEFLNSIGLIGNWKQTSYNDSFRGIFAGIDMLYDSIEDRFISKEVIE
jgi:hypothetical protein